jgi:tetratricopeptide (TPR) repeat protein
VSKEVFDRIQKAQELIDADDPQSALKMLNSLKTKKGLTEYELQNVLNYIGFVHYNMDNITAAIATYEEMLRIPSIEDQIRKQTTYTLAQLATMEEDYNKALRLLDEWFVLETNPAPEPYILYAQNLYQINRYSDMVKPIEMAQAREGGQGRLVRAPELRILPAGELPKGQGHPENTAGELAEKTLLVLACRRLHGVR